MGLFAKRFEREGAGRPLPEGGLKRYAAVLFNNFWKLVGANLLFLAFSLPVITMPAALCALNRVCMLLIRNGYCFLWQDFWQEFKRSFTRSLFPALLVLVTLFGGYYAMSLGLTNTGVPVWSQLFWAVGICLTGAGGGGGAYFFALVSLVDQSNADAMKNALLLGLIRPLRALGVFAIVAVTVFLIAVLMPVSIALVLLCSTALAQFSVCFLVNGMADAYVLNQEPNNS